MRGTMSSAPGAARVPKKKFLSIAKFKVHFQEFYFDSFMEKKKEEKSALNI